MIRILGAITLDRAIGMRKSSKDPGSLPWTSEDANGDLSYFKKLTEDQSVIMGRRTFESLTNGPLPNRHNIVIGNKEGKDIFSDHIVIWAKNLTDAISDARKLQRNIYLIGGEQIFAEGMRYADEIIITIVPIKAYERFETSKLVYFPPITNNFARFSVSQHPLNPELRIIVYRRLGGKLNVHKSSGRKPASR